MVGCWLAGLFWSRERERERETDFVVCNPFVYFVYFEVFFNLGPTFITRFFNMGGRYFAGVLGASFVVPMLSIDQIWEQKQVDSDKQTL
jgi:hypothetical protein